MTRNFLMGMAAAAALTLGASAVHAQPAAADPNLKAPEVLAFIGVKPGDKLADIVAGRMLRAEAQAVGPKGRVYAVVPDEVVKAHPDVGTAMQALAKDPANANITVLTGPINSVALPSGLDEVFIRQNYHDLYDPFMGPADVPAFNKAVFKALKPGGVFVILDHADAPGSGITGTNTRHRIEKERVIADLKAAGFKLDGESKALANPDDDHTKMVFNPAIRGKTDQFLLKFRKPR